jgi:hypothetical protein
MNEPITITISVPPFWQAAAVVILAILLLAWLFHFLARYFYSRGWYECEDRHVHFDAQRGSGSTQRERI